MICLTHQQVVEWMSKHLPEGTTFQVHTDAPQLETIGYQWVNIPFPRDSGKKVHLARIVYDLFKDERQMLVWIQNCEIFTSSGHIPLLLRIREALGELRPVTDWPGHIFTNQEGSDIVSMMIMSLQFFWDCLMVAESGKTVFHISHDESCDLLTKDKSAALQLTRLLNDTK